MLMILSVGLILAYLGMKPGGAPAIAGGFPATAVSECCR